MAHKIVTYEETSWLAYLLTILAESFDYAN